MRYTTIITTLLGTSLLFTQCQSNTDKKETKASASLKAPSGWFKAGSNPDDYDMGIDEKSGMNNSNAATIRSLSSTATTSEFGTLMQNMSADSFAGKKIKMSGYLKSADITGWAGLWLRVDCKNNKEGQFDNMQNRAVKGTTDWKKFDIVLQVDSSAANIAYGALLSGSGQVWFDQLNFEVVSDNTPVTDITNAQGSTLKASNLDFEK